MHDRFDFFSINHSTDAIQVRWSFRPCDKWQIQKCSLDALDSKSSSIIPNMLNITERSHLLAVSRPKTPEAVNKIMLQMAVLNERLVAYSGETVKRSCDEKWPGVFILDWLRRTDAHCIYLFFFSKFGDFLSWRKFVIYTALTYLINILNMLGWWHHPKTITLPFIVCFSRKGRFWKASPSLRLKDLDLDSEQEHDEVEGCLGTKEDRRGLKSGNKQSGWPVMVKTLISRISRSLSINSMKPPRNDGTHAADRIRTVLPVGNRMSMVSEWQLTLDPYSIYMVEHSLLFNETLICGADGSNTMTSMTSNHHHPQCCNHL